MVRCTLILASLLICLSPTAQAGWLTDKLKDAAEKIGSRAIDEGAQSAYEGTKAGVKETASSDDQSAQGQEPAEEEPEEVSEETSSSEDEEAQRDLGSQPAFQGARAGAPARSAGSYRSAGSHGPPRTDLHFSADTVMVDRDTPVKEGRGKMYVDGESMRVEMQDPEEGKTVITILDGRGQKLFLLMPDEKTFMEYPMSQAEGADDWGFTMSLEPCEGYRVADEMGNATHDGRSVVEWRCEDPEDADEPDTVTLWFDPKLKIPLRTEDSAGNRFEFRNLKEGKQPTSLFAVPSGYTRINLWGGGSAGMESSNPYAPKVDPVAGSEGSLGATILVNTVVPDAEAVGIPAYPGARVLQAQNRPMIEGGTNHIIVLLTTDSEDRVTSFYRSQLKGWKEEKIMGMTPVFHQGSGKFDPFSASGQSAQNLVVETIIESMKYEVMPRAKTKITIGYQPRR